MVQPYGIQAAAEKAEANAPAFLCCCSFKHIVDGNTVTLPVRNFEIVTLKFKK